MIYQTEGDKIGVRRLLKCRFLSPFRSAFPAGEHQFSVTLLLVGDSSLSDIAMAIALMAIFQAIYRWFLYLLFMRMFFSYSGDVVKAVLSTNHSLAIFSTLQSNQSDAQFLAIPPIVEPYKAVSHQRLLLLGRSMVHRRQNLRFCVGTMTRRWGQDELIHGRIIEGRRFQVSFPSEESMEMVIRCGPWAFAEQMVILQRCDLSMKQRPPRKPPWNQHISEDIGDATRMRIIRSNQQHVWVYGTITKTYIFFFKRVPKSMVLRCNGWIADFAFRKRKRGYIDKKTDVSQARKSHKIDG